MFGLSAVEEHASNAKLGDNGIIPIYHIFIGPPPRPTQFDEPPCFPSPNVPGRVWRYHVVMSEDMPQQKKRLVSLYFSYLTTRQYQARAIHERAPLTITLTGCSLRKSHLGKVIEDPGRSELESLVQGKGEGFYDVPKKRTRRMCRGAVQVHRGKKAGGRGVWKRTRKAILEKEPDGDEEDSYSLGDIRLNHCEDEKVLLEDLD
jgi:hypothetical protein